MAQDLLTARSQRGRGHLLISSPGAGGLPPHHGSLCPRQSQKVPLLEAERPARTRRTPWVLSSIVTGPCGDKDSGAEPRRARPEGGLQLGVLFFIFIFWKKNPFLGAQ